MIRVGKGIDASSAKYRKRNWQCLAVLPIIKGVIDSIFPLG
jgi:hypothetical protein